METQPTSKRKASFFMLLPSLLFGILSTTFLLPFLVSIKVQWYTKCDLSVHSSIHQDDYLSTDTHSSYPTLFNYLDPWSIRPDLLLQQQHDDDTSFNFILQKENKRKRDHNNDDKDKNNSEKCVPNYAVAQKYSGLFDSLRSFIALFTASMLGKVSDSFGRKPVMIFTNIMTSIPFFALLFTNGESAFAFFFSVVLSGFSGAVYGVGFPSVLAYIADSHPKESRVKYYGYLGAVTSISLCMSPFISYLSRDFTNQTVFIISTSMACFNILYLILVLPESLDESKRVEFQFTETMNPLAPLALIRRSRFIFWVSALTFFCSLPDSGIAEIALFYLDKILDLNKDEAKNFNSLYLGLTGLFALITQTVLLWFLRKKLKLTEIPLLIIGSIANILHMVLYIVLFYYPHRGVLLLNAVVTGVYFLLSPTMSALLSMHISPFEQGYAQGAIAAVRGITGALGPLVFSQLFGAFEDQSFVPFAFGTVFCSATIYIVLFPLKDIVQKYRELEATSDARHQSLGSSIPMYRGESLRSSFGAFGNHGEIADGYDDNEDGFKDDLEKDQAALDGEDTDISQKNTNGIEGGQEQGDGSISSNIQQPLLQNKSNNTNI